MAGQDNFTNLVFLFAVNVLFFTSGICLNSVVIISFWRSAQLRKKLCYFMIMILSCCDLLAVFTNHSVMASIAILWLIGKLESVSGWLHPCYALTGMSLVFSLFALLVLGFDRYLAVTYPLFHRTSVTKRRLLLLFALLVLFELLLAMMALNEVVIKIEVGVIILSIIVVPTMLFVNFSLVRIVLKHQRRHDEQAQEKSKAMKNIPSCLLAVACFLLFSIPTFVFVGLKISDTNETPKFKNKGAIAGLWAKTIVSMNSTLNCLIFYWKNKILRKEGMKVIRSLMKG